MEVAAGKGLVVGLVCTHEFRRRSTDPFTSFLTELLEWAQSSGAQVVMTANTHEWAHGLRKAASSGEEALWAQVVRKVGGGSSGVVELTYELIERRIDAVFHLASGGEINTNLPMKVLKRQALVHDVLYTASLEAASSLVRHWRLPTDPAAGGGCASEGLLDARVSRPPTRQVPLARMAGKKTIALISHDGKKLDMCLLVVEHLRTLLTQFDHIICTGTTGGWITKFIRAAAASADSETLAPYAKDLEHKIICCESGPRGGDVQIAHAVLRQLCHQVIFLIDPMAAHPHEPDISFFEQVIDVQGVHLATNLQSAQQLLAQYERS